MSLVVFTALFSFSIAYGVKGLVDQSFKNPSVQYWKFDQVSLSCGYVISSLEMTNTVLNLRRLMSEKIRHKFQTVGYVSQYFCAIVSAVAALIMYVAFYERGLQDLYFKTFFEHQAFKILYFFYPLILANNLLSCTIFEIEMLEKIKLFQKLLRNDARELSIGKIFLARITFFSLVAVVASFLSDLRKVYSISGIFLNSSIALIIPGYLSFKRPEQLRMKDSTVDKLVDAGMIFFGLLTIVLYVKESLLK
jgi:Transmembrane amino acid transporter protein